MNRYLHPSMVAIAASVCVSGAVRAEKNMIEAEFRDLPAHYERLLEAEPDKWNFNFRPYGAASADTLWSDPIVQRDAVSGRDLGDKAPTAVFASCNEDGFTILVFAGEPQFKDRLEQGLALPPSSLECFFAPGDADTSGIEHYYQFMCGANEPRITGVYPWFMEDRGFRTIEGRLQVDSRTLPNGNLLRIFVPWSPLFDRLPFTEKRDNFWRLSVIRWGAPGGGQTWGGVVHAATSAGYVRWPDFTDEQKTAIRKATLLKGWTAYKNLAGSRAVNPAVVNPRTEEYYTETIAALPQSFRNVNEDFGFGEAWLENASAKRNALGASIAAFETLSQAEQEAFYAKASDMLFNFGYDLEQAYADYLKAKIFAR